MRLRGELWAQAGEAAKARGLDMTAFTELALEQLVHRNGNGRPVSPKLREGVKPRPKAKSRRGGSVR